MSALQSFLMIIGCGLFFGSGVAAGLNSERLPEYRWPSPVFVVMLIAATAMVFGPVIGLIWGH